MIRRLVVYGILLLGALIANYEWRNTNWEDTREIVIVNPRNPVNPVVKKPYQDEYERMLYPTVRIIAGFSTGSGVVISVERASRCAAFGVLPTIASLRGALSVEGIAILTAAHVVEDQSVVDVELYDLTVITATVVITDTIRDLALLSIEHRVNSIEDAENSKPYAPRSTLYSASLAPESYTAYLFTPVYTVGCSLGLLPRPSQGIISAINTDSWEVSSPILPGNSGGPVYDGRTYEVIGIAVWVKVYNGQLITTMAGVVPITEIYEFLTATKTRRHQE